jgi:hypothetical protein
LRLGCHLSDPQLDLGDQKRRPDPPGSHDPEQFWRHKMELAGQIAAMPFELVPTEPRLPLLALP